MAFGLTLPGTAPWSSPLSSSPLSSTSSSAEKMRKLMFVTVLAFFVSSATARPQDQIAPAEVGGHANQMAGNEPWIPIVEKDRWRAFKPVKKNDQAAPRWWDMRMDDKLWQHKAPTPSPVVNKPAALVSGESKPIPGLSEAIIDSNRLPQEPVALVLPREPSHSSPAADETPETAEAAEDKTKTPSMSSQDASSALKAAPNSNVKKNNTRTPTNKDASVTEKKGEKDVVLPGKTGYLRPFYRKSDNNPFVEEEDSMPFYGSGVYSHGETNWGEGIPYLPEHSQKKTESGPRRSDILVEEEKGDLLVDGGAEEQGDSADIQVTEGGSDDSDEVQGSASQDIKGSVDEKRDQIEGEKSEPTRQKEKIMSSVPLERLSTPLAQTAAGDEASNVDLNTAGVDVVIPKGEELKSDGEGKDNKPVEKPQGDMPFVDFPDWDNSLFDKLDDEDEDEEKDAADKIENKDAVIKKGAKVADSDSDEDEDDDEYDYDWHDDEDEDNDDSNDETGVKTDDDKKDKDDKEKNSHSISNNEDSDDDASFDVDEEEIDEDENEEDEEESDEDESSDESENESDEEDTSDESDEYYDFSDSDDEDNDDDDDEEEDYDFDDNDDDWLGDYNSDAGESYYYFDSGDSVPKKSGEDHYEVIERSNGAITISPIKTSTAAPTERVASRQKRLDWDDLSLQADQPANPGSQGSHYNKGVIYDSPHDDHMQASAAKTTTNKNSIISTNVNIKRGGDPAPASRDNLKKPTSAKDFKLFHSPSPIRSKSGHAGHLKMATTLTQFEPTGLHTESDVSTSPNPRPPGVVRDDTVAAPTTTASTTTSTTNTATTTTSSIRDLELNTAPVSYPIVFCRGDYECPVSRVCHDNVCKCVPQHWCDDGLRQRRPGTASGHRHRHPRSVCGTDGKLYESHCHLHRAACLAQKHIHVDRRGRCFRDNDQVPVVKEKSWLMEQENLLHAWQVRKTTGQEKMLPQADQPAGQNTDAGSDHKSEVIPSDEIVQFPVKPKKGEKTSSVKKDGKSVPATTTATTTTTTTPRPTRPKEKCTWSQMNAFKDSLLFYYCQKFVEPNCPLEVKSERQYLSMLMFSYYDKDFDYLLTAEELDDKERDEHFDNRTVRNCHLHDFVRFADSANSLDSKLTVTEFSKAFELSDPTPKPDAHIEVITTLASAGNGLELKCGIASEAVVWKRQGAQLSDDKKSHQLMVFEDGALYFSNIGLHHIGNYTCMDAQDTSLAQVHRLRVQTMPRVTVTPVTQTHTRGLDIELKCHAEGVPKPSLTWSKGEASLDSLSHVTYYYDGSHVVIHNATPEEDAGTYTCSAHNQAGTAHKSVSVSVVEASNSPSTQTQKEAGTFVVFHHQGITAFDPLHCLARHKTTGAFGNFKFIPDAMDGPLTLCRPGSDCRWGSAVRVGRDFIYASQPEQNRVVVMEAGGSWLPLQVIDTDARPGKMWYVEHLDQVWVMCQGQQGSEGKSTIVVIRDASISIQHRSVHTRPVGNHFDMVEGLFIAPPNDIGHEFDFGYVSHKGQSGLFKVNLEDMSYTKAVDLSNYGCVPTNVAFVPIGGHVIVQCVSTVDQHNLQLTLDYLTDTVTSTTALTGRPMTSPDSRHVITVDQFSGRVTVASVSEEGVMATTYEVTVSASISDVAFMPAASHEGYDLILTSADDDDVIIMNLVTGKVEKIQGSKFSDPSRPWHPSPVRRHISAGDAMSSFLMAPSMSTLAVLDISFRQVACEFSGQDSDVSIHVPSPQTSS